MSSIVALDSFDRFGLRLKEERQRLQLTQQELAEIGGVKRSSQYLYESSERTPTMEYIARIVSAGADFKYLLLGERSSHNNRRICLDEEVLDRALALADQVSRDERGRLLDSEIRNRIAKEIFVLISDLPAEDVNWEQVRHQVAEL